jgi:hypothetical protein
MFFLVFGVAVDFNFGGIGELGFGTFVLVVCYDGGDVTTSYLSMLHNFALAHRFKRFFTMRLSDIY